MNHTLIFVSNRLIRLIGNLFKILSYPFHWLLPKVRFTIPEYSKAKLSPKKSQQIPRIIWQTNYSSKSTLPIYLNYLFNRLMSLQYDYYYVSTEARAVFLKEYASKAVYDSYMQLNDGAAQADLWRLAVLNIKGGIYLDIDACLVWPLEKLIQSQDESLYISMKKNGHYTNFFLASAPNNSIYQQAIDKIVDNITHYDGTQGVYKTTGPMVLTEIINDRIAKGESINSVDRTYVCIQGTFSNEYFQYLDKPRGKWTHTKAEDLIKKG